MIDIHQQPERRVILAYWKHQKENPFEVFSNLKIFCQSYPAYSYNTLNNYLSKGKKAFENDTVRIERKGLITKPVVPVNPVQDEDGFKIARVVRKAPMKEIDQDAEDLDYWLSRSPGERLAAVCFLVAQSLKPGERMDKTLVTKRKLKDDEAG